MTAVLALRAAIFDLDGTLIDSRGDIVAALNHALIEGGESPLPGQVIVRHVGDGARTLCARILDLPENAPEVDLLLSRFLAYYTAHPVEFTRWMPGAQQALDELGRMDDMALGLCTNKPRATTDAVLAALGVTGVFGSVMAGGDHAEKKPAPEPLLKVAAELGREPGQVVMIGDGHQDVQAAHAAGMRAIAVESGFGSRRRLLESRPEMLLPSLAELPEVIRRWRERAARSKAP